MSTNDGLKDLFDEVIEDAIRHPEHGTLMNKKLGKYLFGSELGKGGMGTVYLAKDASVGRTVVIKVVNFPNGEPEHCKMMVERFRREARAACRVGQHPNVAFVYAFDEIEGRHLLVMEHIEGRTLREELVSEFGRPRALHPKKAVQVVLGILKGLEAIHAAKIVHRDLKPGNVMLTHGDDQVKILDFGLGKAFESSGDPALDLTLTQARMPVGSPMFMSPEQIRSLPVDGRTDIYAVGAMLFQMLTGRPPFRGKDAVEIFDRHRTAPVPPIVSPSGASIPPELQAVVRKALAKDPAERYPTAAAMAEAVRAVDFDPKPAVVAPRPRPWGAILALLAVVSALAVGLVLMTGVLGGAERGDETPVETASSVKAVVETKASGGIQIPSPPPAPSVATASQGCALLDAGRVTDAVATLTRALAASPEDPEGLFCLCSALVRQPESGDAAKRACTSYRNLAPRLRDADKTRRVDIWLRRLGR